MRLFLPISVSCDGVITHSGPVSGEMAGGAQAVQPREVSLLAGSPALNCGGDMCLLDDDN